MDVKQILPVLLCVIYVLLMPGNAYEFSTDVLYEIFSRRMDDVLVDQKLLRLDFEEAVRNMGHLADRITKVEGSVNNMEKQVDKITALEEATNIMVKKVDTEANVEEAAVQNATLEKNTKLLEKQNDRITRVEQAIMKIQEQSNKIANLEGTIKRIEKQDVRLTSLEEANDKNKDQAGKLTQLGEFTNKIDKQVDRITALEEIVRQVNNKTTGITNIENEVQHLNKTIENLENSTLSNEKAISDVTRLVKDNDLKELKVSESSINAITKNVMKQSVAISRMVSAEKMYVRGMKESYDKKLSNFTNEVKLQMSTLNASVESQISSFETILKVTEQSVSDALNDYSNHMNDTFLNFHQEIVTTVKENEQRLDTLQEKVNLESDRHRKTMITANNELQQLKTKIVNVESIQDIKVAFTAYGISGTSSLVFPHVLENHGNGYDSSTGKFTCKFPGIYIFSFQISKRYGRNTDLVVCYLRKNSVSVLGAIQDPYYVSTNFINDYSGYSLSLSGTFYLNTKDTVNVGECSGISSVFKDKMSSFTGVLVTPDNK